MKIKGLNDTDFVNYKKASMFIAFSKCSFKCGQNICQNFELTKEPTLEVLPSTLIDLYKNNPITSAIVCGGLEPFDTWDDLKEFIEKFRVVSKDDIVIYTGYNEDEIEDKLKILQQYDNIIIKFGRFIPNQSPHKDELLGVDLASDNQYARCLNENKG